MTFIDASAPIAAHAAVTTNVHGTGAGNVIVGDDELSAFSKIKGGSYVGNNGNNKAIPHSLAHTPKFVFLVENTAMYSYHIVESGEIRFQTAGTFTGFAVTAWDSTNFYVGNTTNAGQSANSASHVYTWIAIG